MVIIIRLYLQLNQSNKPSKLLRSSARRTSVVSFVLDGLVLVEELLIGLVLLLRLDAALLELDRQLVDLLDLVEWTDAGSVDGVLASHEAAAE